MKHGNHGQGKGHYGKAKSLQSDPGTATGRPQQLKGGVPMNNPTPTPTRHNIRGTLPGPSTGCNPCNPGHNY